MDILNNPFFILGASVFDTQAKLSSLAQNKSKSLDRQLVQKAYKVLVDPKLRLQAEIAWVYNFSYAVLNPQLQQRLTEYQKSLGRKEFVPYSNVDPAKLFKEYPCPFKQFKEIANPCWAAFQELYGVAPNGLGALSAANILLLLLKFQWKPAALEPAKNKPADMVVMLLQAFDDINLGALGDLINQTRQQAKFPPISKAELQTAFDNHRHYVRQVLVEFFDTLPSQALPDYLHNVQVALTNNFQTHLQSSLLGELMQAYETQTEPFFQNQKDALYQSLNYWATAENDQLPEKQVLYYINACLKQARAWLQVLKPLNTWVRVVAQPKLMQAQNIEDPAAKQAFFQKIQLQHPRMYELFGLLKDYMSYIPQLGSENARSHALNSFKQLFVDDLQFATAFQELERVVGALEHDELKELQAGLESPEMCNFLVQAKLPDGVDPEDNRVILTSKTIEFQQQLLSIKRILSYRIDKEDDKWVVYITFENGTKWRLPFDECLTAFVFVHHLSMVLLEYKFSVWMTRLRSNIPVTFAPILMGDGNLKHECPIAVLNLWDDGLELQELPPETQDTNGKSSSKVKTQRYDWQEIDLKRIVHDMSWSELKIYLKGQNNSLCVLKYSVENFRLLCCLFVAIQDNQNSLITDCVKNNAASASTAQNAVLHTNDSAAS